LASAPKVLILNGPNLNLLGEREPAVYGRTTLADIEKAALRHGKELGLAVECRQSNHEGEIVTWIQEARRSHAALIVNAGAYSHTSIAIRDALQAFGKPIIEVHLSNIFRREPFRHHSHVSEAAQGVICGLGAAGYRLALVALSELLETVKEA
jgi:3-dehydroquinate dehydratase-2